MLLPERTPIVSTWDVIFHGSKITSYVMPVLTATVWQPFFIYSRLILNAYTELLELWETNISAQAFPKCLCFPPECLYYPG